VYDTQKGNFTWEKNVKPQYSWYSGTIDAVSLKDPIDPTKPVALNWPVGRPDDPNARIAPFKVHTGKQPYDTVNKTMLVPHLFGPPDSNAYWAKYIKPPWRGMKKAGLPYSGQFDFVETSYVFPTHMGAQGNRQLQRVPPGTTAAWRTSVSTCRAATATRSSRYWVGGGARLLAGVLLHALGRAVSGTRKEG
jgi:hypothetical protein